MLKQLQQTATLQQQALHKSCSKCKSKYSKKTIATTFLQQQQQATTTTAIVNLRWTCKGLAAGPAKGWQLDLQRASNWTCKGLAVISWTCKGLAAISWTCKGLAAGLATVEICFVCCCCLCWATAFRLVELSISGHLLMLVCCCLVLLLLLSSLGDGFPAC